MTLEIQNMDFDGALLAVQQGKVDMVAAGVSVDDERQKDVYKRQGETPVVNSRYSIVLATAKRARQLIGGEEPLVRDDGRKPLSIAIDELYHSKIKIVGEEETKEED